MKHLFYGDTLDTKRFVMGMHKKKTQERTTKQKLNKNTRNQKPENTFAQFRSRIIKNEFNGIRVRDYT